MHGDYTLGLNIQGLLQQHSDMWDRVGSVTDLETVDRTTFVLPFLALLNALHAQPAAIETFWLFVFLSIAGTGAIALSRYVARHYTGDASAIGTGAEVCIGLYAMFAPWNIEQLQATYLWLAAAVLPWFLYWLFRLLDSRTQPLPKAFICAVLWSLASLIPHTAIYYAAITAVVTLIYVVLDRSPAAIVESALVVALYVPLNWAWIFVTVQGLGVAPLSPGYVFTPDQLFLYSRNASLLRVLEQRAEWIYWYVGPGEGKLWWHLLALIPATFAFVGAAYCVKRRTPALVALAMLMIVFVVASLGGNNPLYTWLTLDAPKSSAYGWLFRAPGKFGFALPALNAALITVAICSLSARWPTVRRTIPVILTIALCVTVGPKIWSYLTFYYRPVTPSPAYSAAASFFAMHANQGDRVIEVAPYDAAQNKNSLHFEASYVWNPDRIAGNFIVRSLPIDAVGYYHFTSWAWRPVYDLLAASPDSQISSLLRSFGIRYVLFHDDLVGAADAGLRMRIAFRRAGLKPVFIRDGVVVYQVAGPESLGGNVDARYVERSPGVISVQAISDVPVVRINLPPDPYWIAYYHGSAFGPSAAVARLTYNLPLRQGDVLRLVYMPDIWMSVGLRTQVLLSVLILVLVAAAVLRDNYKFSGVSPRAQT